MGPGGGEEGDITFGNKLILETLEIRKENTMRYELYLRIQFMILAKLQIHFAKLRY